MDRINVYLPKRLRQQVKLRADRTQRPQAEVIIELIEQGLTKTEAAPDGLRRLARLGLRGPRDLAASIDHYLYEGDDA
jgi:predicted DNA-binding protein